MANNELMEKAKVSKSKFYKMKNRQKCDYRGFA